MTRRLTAAVALVALCLVPGRTGAAGYACAEVPSPHYAPTGQHPTVAQIHNTAAGLGIPASARVSVINHPEQGWLVKYAWACPE